MSPTRLVVAGLLSLSLSACHEGSGSDIGPKLLPVPNYDYRVTVRDDSGEPVTGARLTFAGLPAPVVTGRRGRAFLRAALQGVRTITIDGAAAAATDSSHLGTLTVATTFPGNNELSYDVYLPDGAASATQNVTAGVQGAAVTLDDSATSGAILTIGAGDSVTQGAQSTITLRAGQLSPGHLPPTLEDVTGTPVATSRGIFVFPVDLQIGTGASLSVLNTELGLPPAQPATLYRLDQASGTWVQVGVGAEAGGRIVTGPGAVTRGGLYCFAVSSPATTQVIGRLIDQRSFPVTGALVRAPQAQTRTDADGRFALVVPRLDAGGNDRQVTIEASGGRLYLPARTAYPSTTLNAAVLDLGTLTLDTFYSTNARTLMIHRGKVDAFRRLRMSNAEQLVAESGNGGVDGKVEVEDIGAEILGFLTTVPINEFLIRRTWGRFFLYPGALDNALTIFSDEELWRSSNSGGSVVQAFDSYGTGPIARVHTMIGSDPSRGYIGLTDFNGFIGVGNLFFSEFSMVQESASDGRKVVSAFTVVSPASGRVEVPIERALRTTLGRFRRFGMYRGNLTSTVGHNTRRVRATGAMVLQDFYDEVFLGRPSDLDAPIQLSPSAGSVAYRVGVPQGVGHLVAAVGTTTGGAFTLDRLGIVSGLDVAEGALAVQDIDLGLVASQPFTINGGLLGLNGTIPPADLRLDLAGELADGSVVDMVRGLAPTAVGGDASVTLPPVSALPSTFRGYVAALGGTAMVTAGPSANTTVSQRIFARFDGVSSPQRSQMAVPAISLPVPDADVSSTGFRVDYQAPLDCQYVVLSLRSETATEIRDWTVLLPPDRTSFDFHPFTVQMPQVLAPDPASPAPPRTWKLTLRCGRVDTGPLVQPGIDRLEAFYRIQSNWVGLTEATREVGAASSASFNLRMTN